MNINQEVQPQAKCCNNSKKKSICILLDPAHGWNVAGKCSPDKRLKEYLWSRKAIEKIIKKLQNDGYRAVKITESTEEIGLANRVQIEHNYSSIFGRSNTLFVSVHVNAAGGDGKWHSASGWQCHICKSASAKSKRIASLLYSEVETNGMKVRRPKKGQDWWENDFYVLKNTYCPAVLTENFFQDNKDDVDFLLSDEGINMIVDAHVQAIEKYVDELIMK